MPRARDAPVMTPVMTEGPAVQTDEERRDAREIRHQCSLWYERPYTVHEYTRAQYKGRLYFVDASAPGEFILTKEGAGPGQSRVMQDDAPDDEWQFRDFEDTPGLRIWYNRSLSKCCAVQRDTA